jgi:biotin-(acetyl-CoA carboxylase) ligase
LIESFAPTGHNQVFLIGVGINFAVDWSMAPRELLDKATCLSSHSGNPASASQLLFQLIEILAGRLNRWILEPRSWHPDWHHRCLLTGRTVTIGLPNGTVGPSALVGTMGNHLTGRCEGVAADGQLLLRTADGKLVSINVGQVVSFE